MEITRNWWMFALRGTLAVLFGIIALIDPRISLVFLVAVFGAYALLDGILAVYMGIRARPTADRWWSMVLLGAVGILVGIVAFANPGLTLFALLYTIAFWAIFTGVLEIAAAIDLRKTIRNEWILGLDGTLSVLLGVILLALPPVTRAYAVALWVGLYAIVYGVAQIALGFRFRGMSHHGRPSFRPA